MVRQKLLENVVNEVWTLITGNEELEIRLAEADDFGTVFTILRDASHDISTMVGVLIRGAVSDPESLNASDCVPLHGWDS